jgi:hypothetical protein
MFKKNIRLLTGVGKPRHIEIQYDTMQQLARWANTPTLQGVTCRGKRDGGGAQLQALMSAFAFGRAIGTRYFHSPLTVVGAQTRNDLERHGCGAEWINRWERFVDFRSDIELVPDDANTCGVLEFFDQLNGKPMVVEAEHFHAYCDHNPDTYRLVQAELRERCESVKAVVDQGIMAVHIRRGDVVTKHPSRLTPLEQVAAIIRRAREGNPELVVRVYSVGEANDFLSLPTYCELHLNTDVFCTLAALINAEILVMAKSSLSYVAALLSRGTVIYEPFWHKPLSDWISVEEFNAHPVAVSCSDFQIGHSGGVDFKSASAR